MRCQIIRVGDATAIVCGRGNRSTKRCFAAHCGRPSEKLCDFQMPNGKTCDRPCCHDHHRPVKGEKDKDLCLEHHYAASRKP